MLKLPFYINYTYFYSIMKVLIACDIDTALIDVLDIEEYIKTKFTQFDNIHVKNVFVEYENMSTLVPNVELKDGEQFIFETLNN